MNTYLKLFSVLVLPLIGMDCGIQSEPVPMSKTPSDRPANVILMIGDGMGLSQLSAFMYSNDNHTVLEQFPVTGFQKTHSFDNLITDSAGAATAFACGVKTYNNAIGITADTLPCRTIVETADSKGLATGMVVTSSIVHATPAAFIAHFPMRSFFEQIAADFLKTDIDIFVGGGEKYFTNRALDNRNLINELSRKGYYITRLLPSKKAAYRKEKIAVFTAAAQPEAHPSGRNYLPNATDLAARFLQGKSEIGFFLLVEGSQIDWAGHANNAPMLLSEIKDFEAAIRKALTFAKQNGNTLVIVTADHETGGMAIKGGKKFGKPEIAFTTNGHTAAMVPVFAFGPKANLFSGIYDNTEIYYKIRRAYGWTTEE